MNKNRRVYNHNKVRHVYVFPLENLIMTKEKVNITKLKIKIKSILIKCMNTCNYLYVFNAPQSTWFNNNRNKLQKSIQRSLISLLSRPVSINRNISPPKYPCTYNSTSSPYIPKKYRQRKIERSWWVPS